MQRRGFLASLLALMGLKALPKPESTVVTLRNFIEEFDYLRPKGKPLVYKHLTYGLGFKVSTEMVDPLNQRAVDMARHLSAAVTREQRRKALRWL